MGTEAVPVTVRTGRPSIAGNGGGPLPQPEPNPERKSQAMGTKKVPFISRRMFNKSLLGATAATIVPATKPKPVPRPLLLSSSLDDTSLYRASAVVMAEPMNWPDQWNYLKLGNIDGIRYGGYTSAGLFNAYMATMERIRGAGMDQGIQSWI